ncbi:uncharacterized protein LOC113752979 isoform X2 [Coffea eugenioides]|uniref:uncharacterized protein LOC113752979 isoform X2 n=1 Tax=Coffea eugenioides TaxID=49369 RepID=UPI000F61502B|nr:uncharacterized protein LOC113752979 isoform X2 [Coffea eugenioides]
MNPHHHTSPCLHCHPHSYIRMVHSLIERCLMLRMDRDQCIKALAKHARIQPQITLTVWRELMKENKEFFQAYLYAISPRPLINGGVHKIPRFGRRKLWK